VVPADRRGHHRRREACVDDINAAGGVLGQPIEIVQFDNKSDPPLGADSAIDVINRGAKAILFPSDFDFGAPGAYVA
jgi:branched-chain amino acid transport system substrate-binding protein